MFGLQHSHFSLYLLSLQTPRLNQRSYLQAVKGHQWFLVKMFSPTGTHSQIAFVISISSFFNHILEACTDKLIIHIYVRLCVILEFLLPHGMLGEYLLTTASIWTISFKFKTRRIFMFWGISSLTCHDISDANLGKARVIFVIFCFWRIRLLNASL